jgi:hypothetical protein
MSPDVAQRSNRESSLRRKDMSVEERNRVIALRSSRAFDSGDLRTREETTAPGFVDHNPLEGQLLGSEGAIHALCLVTYDLSAEEVYYRRRPSVYYSYDPDFVKGDILGRFSAGHVLKNLSIGAPPHHM